MMEITTADSEDNAPRK